jgi:hypothetical protein
MSEKKCPHCAMMIPRYANPCPFCKRDIPILLLSRKIIWGFTISAVLAVLIFVIISATKTNNTIHPIQKVPKAVNANKLTPANHLSEAKKALNDGYRPNKDIMKTTWGRVTDAKNHLLSIPKNSPEWTGEGQKLWKEVERREKEINKAAEILTEKLMTEQRKKFAEQYEIALLDKGMDTTISTSGNSRTILRIEWILMSRPLVYKFINDESAMSNLRKLGFKKITFTDGYYHTWSHNLNEER